MMEMSHQSHIIKAKSSMLCDQGYYTFPVRGYFINDLLFTRTFDNNMVQFSGETHHIFIDFFEIKKWIIWIMTKSRRRDSCRELFTFTIPIYILCIIICGK